MRTCEKPPSSDYDGGQLKFAESISSIESVLDASDYRDFLGRWIQFKSQKRPLTYSAIAARGGFSSRSFPRDVVTGRRNLTMTSMKGFIKGLGLDEDWADYFQLLVQREHPEFGPENLTQDAIHLRLHHVRSRIQSVATYLVTDELKHSAYFSGLVPVIFASLGTTEAGATLDEIVLRSNCAKNVIEAELSNMEFHKLLEKRDDRFFPAVSHLALSGLHNEFFAKHFVFNLERAKEIALSDNLKSRNNLCLTSAVSVNRSELPRIKEALRKHLIDFLEEIEDPSGDHVASLVTGFF